MSGPRRGAGVHPEADLATLAGRALDGDAVAWEGLVDRLSGVVWRVVGSYRLDRVDREDVYASTFYRLFEKLDSVQNPAALPGWVATTARREVYALFRRRRRTLPMGELPLQDVDHCELDESVLDDELLRAVLEAFGELPVHGQALLRLLTAVPPLPYKQISELLGIPQGSIGPTRMRLLEQLRGSLTPYLDGDGT